MKTNIKFNSNLNITTNKQNNKYMQRKKWNSAAIVRRLSTYLREPTKKFEKNEVKKTSINKGIF